MSREKQIKTTDWLTRGMSKEQLERKKQEAIMSADLEECHTEFYDNAELYTDYDETARGLIDKGWRKQSEGHWFILEYEYFTCSECGYYHPNGCDTTKEAKEKLAEGIYPKYCAECGAKMKGGAE